MESVEANFKHSDPADYAAAGLAFEKEKWADERSLRDRELRLKEADRPSPWKNPLLIAILAATAAAAGNAVVTFLNNQEQLALQKITGEQNLIIEGIKTGGDVNKAATNLDFLVNAGLISDTDRAKKIETYIQKNKNQSSHLPSLPASASSASPISSNLSSQGRAIGVQIFLQSSQPVGSNCASVLRAAGYLISGVESVTKGSVHDEVKYFWESDEEDANRIGLLLRKCNVFVPPYNFILVTGDNTNPPPKYFEVWVGSER